MGYIIMSKVASMGLFSPSRFIYPSQMSTKPGEHAAALHVKVCTRDLYLVLGTIQGFKGIKQ